MEDNLSKAMQALASSVSQGVVAAQYHIPRRTLHNHLKSGSITKKMGRKSILTQEQEAELCRRVIRFSDVGMPITGALLRSYVYELCEQNNVPTMFSRATCMAGKDWLKAFLKRNPVIAKQQAQHMNPARAQKLNRFIVNDYFTKLEKVMTELQLFDKPDRTYNMDEKGCQLALHHQQKVLTKKGTKRLHLVAPEQGENVSIVACGNAIGNVVPPMVLFKGVRRKSQLADDLPPGSAVEMTQKGSMTTETFVKWIRHFARYKPTGKVLLVFDGAASHLHPDIVNEAEKHDITLFCLPSNTTHELQPMERQFFVHSSHLEMKKF